MLVQSTYVVATINDDTVGGGGSCVYSYSLRVCLPVTFRSVNFQFVGNLTLPPPLPAEYWRLLWYFRRLSSPY